MLKNENKVVLHVLSFLKATVKEILVLIFQNGFLVKNATFIFLHLTHPDKGVKAGITAYCKKSERYYVIITGICQV